MNIGELRERLTKIYHRKQVPPLEDYLEVTAKVTAVLDGEPADYRPHDTTGLPGGLVTLKRYIPTVIVPDIHARMDFLLSVLANKNVEGRTVLDQLAEGAVQIVCVGDGFHAEGRAAKRWAAALEEFQGGYKHHKHMDEEMRESLGVMEMVMELKLNFPSLFHFLKGNHENITNERGGGNFPFMKFANEGLMVTLYMKHFYGEKLLRRYARFEKSLPLLAVGRNYLVSHAEPQAFFDREDLIEYRHRPEVIYGLTWTDNDQAEEGSVRRMIQYYLQAEDHTRCFHFGGHRPVRTGYNLRAGGQYVQFHDPKRFIIALIREEGDIDLDRDIIEIENKVKI